MIVIVSYFSKEMLSFFSIISRNCSCILGMFLFQLHVLQIYFLTLWISFSLFSCYLLVAFCNS